MPAALGRRRKSASQVAEAPELDSVPKRRRLTSASAAEGEKAAAPEEPAEGAGGAKSSTACVNTQENTTAVKGLNQDRKKDAPDILSRIVDHQRCPITQALLVDPVIGEDGHAYERRALEQWLMTKQSSPTTNKPMGPMMVPAFAVLQTVNELIEGGILDADTTYNFLTDRSRIRATRVGLPGPDLAGALSDAQRAHGLATTEAQKKVCEFQKEVIAWMQAGANLSQTAQKLIQDVGAAFGQDFHSWTLQLGDAARAAITASTLKECQLTEWKQLAKGTRVKVIDSPSELHKLCERAPPGAETKVGWNAEMLGFAGQICTVQRVGDAVHANYILRRESPPAGRDFSFPYDAVFLLGS